MKRLPPAKRNQLILVVIVTVALISAVYFFLIGPQKTETAKLEAQTQKQLAYLEQVKKTIKQADETGKKAGEVAAQLKLAEADMASGDVFAWTYDTIRQFKTGYQVDVPSIGQPAQSDVDLLPNFPYKQIRFSLMGTGYYHDIGKFIADLENKFPHMRVVNLVLEPFNGPDSAQEKLSFRMEVIALVKPTV